MGTRRALAGLVVACTIAATTASVSGQSTDVAPGYTGCLSTPPGVVRALAEGDQPSRPCLPHETEIRLSGALHTAELDARYVEPGELEAALAGLTPGGQSCPSGEVVTGVDDAGTLVCRPVSPTPPSPSTTTTTLAADPPGAPELVLHSSRAPSDIARRVEEEILEEIEAALLLPIELHLPATLLNGADVELGVTVSPGSNITLYGSAGCEPGTEYADLVEAEVRTTLPDLVVDLVLSLASLLQDFVFLHLRDADLMVSDTGSTQWVIVAWEGVTTFSATASNAAGTSPCSNAVTVDLG